MSRRNIFYLRFGCSRDILPPQGEVAFRRLKSNIPNITLGATVRLNLQTDFALRLLMHLAANTHRLATIAEVADRFRISRAHLMKVAFLLGKGGFVQTVRGRAGGLRLARDAQDIQVGEVFRFMEGEAELVGCVGSPGGDCVVAKACRLRGVLSEALLAFLAVLDRHTLADLTANPKIVSLLRGKAA
jgi:Rrf2 family nitric oxide-sensitive transcriptional repressor